MRHRHPAPDLRAAAACLLAALGLAAHAAAFSVPGFELIYTAPVETSLQRPELRSPVQVWPELFAGAGGSIDIAEFYVADRPGEPLGPVIEQLSRAGARGVKIRFLVEKKLTAEAQEELARLRRIPNLELRVIDWQRLQGHGILHAKYIVVDRRTAYLGSHNFDWRSLKHVQELGLLISEPQVVAGMQAVFERDWQAQRLLEEGKGPANHERPAHPASHADHERPAAQSERRAYLVASPFSRNPPGVGDSESELSRLIGTAREEIRVQVLTYAPLSHESGRQFYPPIDNALRAAVVRGVKVKLLVSDWSADRPGIDHLKSLSVLPGVSVRMVTIPEAREGFIPFARVVHAKYMVIDGKTLWLGTSNWTGGYLDTSRNLEVVVQDPRLSAEARALHEMLWNSPYAGDLDITRDYPRARRR